MKACRTALALGGLLLSGSAFAQSVGYHNACPTRSGDISGVVAATGRTKVNIPTVNQASLSGLDVLVYTTCPDGPAFTANSDLNAAVASGMGLVVERLLYPFSLDTTALPGGNGFGGSHVWMREVWNDNIEIATGAPIASGPGGTLNNASLDYVSGATFYNMVHYFPAASLPAGAIPFLTTPDPTQIGSFGYTYGSGRVVYSDSQFTITLPGGNSNNPAIPTNWATAGATFLSNAIEWAAGAPPPVTCASEGYTGTKLTWCKNICENGLTGATLDTWIHRWVNRYRDLPYCAQEAGEPELPPQQL